MSFTMSACNDGMTQAVLYAAMWRMRHLLPPVARTVGLLRCAGLSLRSILPLMQQENPGLYMACPPGTLTCRCHAVQNSCNIAPRDLYSCLTLHLTLPL